MRYRITLTTDGKNLGTTIESGKREHILNYGFVFKPDFEVSNNEKIIMWNSNYTIEGNKLND